MGYASKELVIAQNGDPKWRQRAIERARQDDRQARPWAVGKEGVTYRGLGKDTDVTFGKIKGGFGVQIKSKF